MGWRGWGGRNWLERKTDREYDRVKRKGRGR